MNLAPVITISFYGKVEENSQAVGLFLTPKGGEEKWIGFMFFDLMVHSSALKD